jgi:hypothetical protein
LSGGRTSGSVPGRARAQRQACRARLVRETGLGIVHRIASPARPLPDRKQMDRSPVPPNEGNWRLCPLSRNEPRRLAGHFDPKPTFLPAPAPGRPGNGHSRQTFGHAAGKAHTSSSSSALASLRSAVPKPSVNQP